MDEQALRINSTRIHAYIFTFTAVPIQLSVSPRSSFNGTNTYTHAMSSCLSVCIGFFLYLSFILCVCIHRMYVFISLSVISYVCAYVRACDAFKTKISNVKTQYVSRFNFLEMEAKRVCIVPVHETMSKLLEYKYQRTHPHTHTSTYKKKPSNCQRVEKIRFSFCLVLSSTEKTQQTHKHTHTHTSTNVLRNR